VIIKIGLSEDNLKVIPYGHRVKIIKRIRELKGADEVRPIQNNNYEELPDVDAYEAEQRRLFQQAVSEFRGNKGEIKIENHSIKESNNVVSNVK
jgi:hypothetical protein